MGCAGVGCPRIGHQTAGHGPSRHAAPRTPGISQCAGPARGHPRARPTAALLRLMGRAAVARGCGRRRGSRGGPRCRRRIGLRGGCHWSGRGRSCSASRAAQERRARRLGRAWDGQAGLHILGNAAAAHGRAHAVQQAAPVGWGRGSGRRAGQAGGGKAWYEAQLRPLRRPPAGSCHAPAFCRLVRTPHAGKTCKSAHINITAAPFPVPFSMGSLDLWCVVGIRAGRRLRLV